jgi:hypothetical protein
VYYSKDGKQIPVPRKLTKHLDGKDDWEIEDWIRWYEAVNNIDSRRVFAELGEFERTLDRFLKHLELQKLNKGTIRIYTNCLRLALPYFMTEPNLDAWYLLTGGLYDHLASLAISAEQHNRTNQSFGVFYRWLQLQGLVRHRHGLMLMNRPSERSKTPLKRVLLPDEVLAWAKAQTSPEMKFMALAGYFLSLRTGETFGARKSDFVAGSRAKLLEASRVLAKAGMPCSLALNVQNCRRADGSSYKPTELKRGGIVGCFDQTAAKTLIEVVNTAQDNLIVQGKPERWIKLWSKQGIKGIALKDLRRASLYWLGHYTDITLVGLQSHARHTDPKTTALYYRRPEEEFDATVGLLDLDA